MLWSIESTGCSDGPLIIITEMRDVNLTVFKISVSDNNRNQRTATIEVLGSKRKRQMSKKARKNHLPVIPMTLKTNPQGKAKFQLEAIK